MTDAIEAEEPSPSVPLRRGAGIAAAFEEPRWSAMDGPSGRGMSINNGPVPYGSWYSSIHGAPVPKDWTGYEGPADLPTEQALRSMGKSAFAIAPPRYSTIYEPEAPEGALAGTGPSGQPPTTFLGGPQGFASMMLGGLTELVTGFLPEELKRPIVNVASGIGAVADIPLEAVGHVPLPWQPTSEQMFQALPDSEEKQRIRSLMLADDVTAYYQMTQYVRSHLGDWANAEGISVALAPMFDPDATLLQRGLQLLGLGSTAVSRTVAGLSETDRLGEILAQPEGALHPELENIKRRYLLGEYGPVGSGQARDRFLDEIVATGFGFANDPFAGLVMEMVTDPLILTGIGTGLAAKSVRAGALAARAANIARIAQTGGDVVASQAWAAATGAVERARQAARLAGRPPAQFDIAKEFANNPAPQVQRVVQQATDELTTGQRAVVQLAPVVEAANEVSLMLNSPFRIFGNDGAAGVAKRRWGSKVIDGVFGAYDHAKVARVHAPLGEGTAAATRANEALGYAVSYVQNTKNMDSIIKMARVHGKGESPFMMPDAGAPPKTAIEAVGRVDNPAATRETRSFMEHVREEFVPIRPEGLDEAQWAVEYKRQFEVFREQAAQQYAYVTGVGLDVARRLTKGADEDMLSYIHLLNFGAMMRDFVAKKTVDAKAIEARLGQASDAIRQAQAAGGRKVPKAQMDALVAAREAVANELQEVQRLTFVGPDQMTKADAQRVLDMAKAGNVQGVVDAVERYAQLRTNFWAKAMEPNDPTFLANVRTFIEDGMAVDAFVTVISPAQLQKMAPEAFTYMQQAMSRVGGQGYRVGLAPTTDRLWAEVLDSEGNLVGYRGWVDIDVTPTSNLRAPTQFDVLRERVMTPIRAEDMLQQARRKFTSVSVKTFGIDRASAGTLFGALRKAARNRQTTMRAFTHAEFNDILQSADIPAEMKMKLGERGLSLLTAMAMEGDLRVVGLTTKLTSMSKTATAGHGNYMGVLAERLYPLMRFQINPIFLIQEWVEPYYFNLLRGVKPGVKFTDDNIAIHQTIELMNAAPYLADGLEAREFRTIGLIRAHQAAGPKTLLGRTVGRLFPMRAGRVVEVKELNFHRLLRQRFAELTIASWDEMSPGFYARVSAHFNQLDIRDGGKGRLSQEEVVWRWLQSKGFHDPDRATTQTMLWDGTKGSFGRIDGIRRSHVARWYGVDSADALKAEIDAGLVDEWQFKDKMSKQGFDPEYVSRAWVVARGTDIDTLTNEIAAQWPAGSDVAQARELFRGLMEAGAVANDITVDEYVARSFTDKTHWLDSTGRLPPKAYLQVLQTSLREGGVAWIEPGDQRVAGVVARANAMFPVEPHDLVGRHRTQAAKAAGAGADLKAPPFRGTVAGVQLGATDISEVKRALIETLDEGNVEGMSYWYQGVVPAFTSIVEAMPESYIRLLASHMDEVMGTPQRIGDALDVAAMRQEVAARIVVAWGAVQIRTSPQRAFAMVQRILDDVAMGERAGAAAVGLDLQKTQLFRMLDQYAPTLSEKGFAVKLHDFVDSILGNRQRSYFRHGETPMFTRLDGTTVPMDPAAMDAWAMRERGFFDIEMLNYLAAKVAKQEGISEEAALAKVRDITGIPEGAEVKGSPSPAQYEHMLREYNVMADELNQGEGWLGRSYANGNPWTAAELQASLWGRIQKDVGAATEGPMDAFWQNSAQATFEVNPIRHSPYGEALPLDVIDPDVLDGVAYEMSRRIGDILEESTGVTLTRIIVGRPIFRDGKAIPTAMFEFTGSRDALADAMDAVQSLSQSDRVVGMRPAVATGGVMPTVSGVTTAGEQRSWALDFVVPDGLDDDPSMLVSRLHQYLDGTDLSWDGGVVGRSPYEQVAAGVVPEGGEYVVAGPRRFGEFSESVAAAQRDHPYGAAVTAYNADEYAAKGATLYRSTDGRAGVAVTADGDLISVHKHPDSDITTMQPVLAAAARQANRLDAFDIGGKLPDLYGPHGFRPVARVRFDPEYMPDGWDLDRLDHPDVVVMVRDLDGVSGLPAVPTPAEGGYAAIRDTVPYMDYDSAIAAQMDAVGRLPRPAAGGVTGTTTGGGTSLRTLYGPETLPQGTDLAGFEGAIPIPPDVAAKLADGSWAREVDIPYDVPVGVQRRLYIDMSVENDWAQDRALADLDVQAGLNREDAYRERMGAGIRTRLEARDRGRLAGDLAGRHLDAVTASADDLIRRGDPEGWAYGRGRQHLRDEYTDNASPGVLTQRRGRGWAGAIAFGADLRGNLYLNKRNADLTTLVHETFHTFARNLQPSGVKTIHEAWAKAKRQPLPRKNTVLKREAEEWAAAEFERYMASGFTADDTLRLHQIFNAYATWGQQAGRIRGRAHDARLQGVFDQFNPNVHGRDTAVWDSQEYMLAEAARVAFTAAEEEAFRTHYYKRGRNWMERSLNHPYLGMYPLSYMWGKVLPELMRFLIKKPFGVDAPFAGMAMANHVWEAIQLEMSDPDSGISQVVEDMPEALFALELLIPGTPWNLPVNAPAWARRLASAAASHDDIDAEMVLNTMGDTLQYAWGAGRAPLMFAEIAGDIGGWFGPKEPEEEDAVTDAERLATRYGYPVQ